MDKWQKEKITKRKRGIGRMIDYHCPNCGEKLKELSEWIDKYKCPNCGTEWFKVKRLIIELVEDKKKEV